MSKKEIVPSYLRHKIAPTPLLFAPGERKFLKVICTGFAACALWGPVFREPNVFLLFGGPWACAIPPILFMTFLPYRPARGTPFTGYWKSVDVNDPVVLRLVAIFKSNEARKHLRGQAAKMSGILFAILGSLGWALHNYLIWVLPSHENGFLRQGRGSAYWFWLGLFATSICFFLALSTDQIGWAITTWAERESHLQKAN